MSVEPTITWIHLGTYGIDTKIVLKNPESKIGVDYYQSSLMPELTMKCIWLEK